MKNTVFYLLMIVSISLFSQRGLQNNAHIRVSDGTTLKISGNSNYGDLVNNKDMQNDGIVYISGNMTNNGYSGMAVPGTTDEGVFIFNGSDEQTINGSDSVHFENLIMDGAGVNLDQSIAILTKLSFNNGVIRSQHASPVYFENGSISTNSSGGSGFFDVASNASHVSGPVVKIGNEDFVFPVGSGTIFRPAAVKDLSSYTHFTAEYFNEDASNYNYYLTLKTGDLHHVSSCEFWDIEPNNTCNASVVLSWDDTGCGVNLVQDLRVAHWFYGRWISEGKLHTTGDTIQGTITSEIVTTFSPFTLGSASKYNPLPIELGDIWLESDASQTNVYWETHSEINNDYFTVEKSKDLLNWSEAGIISGAGNSTSLNSYAYTDYDFNPRADRYYRLKQTDFDGKYSYSKIMSVDFISDELNSLSYSNSGDNLIIYISGDSATEALLEIMSITGAIVFSEKLYLNPGDYAHEVAKNLEKGIYLISLKTEYSTKSVKAIL